MTSMVMTKFPRNGRQKVVVDDLCDCVGRLCIGAPAINCRIKRGLRRLGPDEAPITKHKGRVQHVYATFDEVHHWTDDDLKLNVVQMPLLDTGIGREAGFRDDAHLIEVAMTERAAMPEYLRDIYDEIDRKFEHATFFGSDGKA